MTRDQFIAKLLGVPFFSPSKEETYALMQFVLVAEFRGWKNGQA
jgi:hypothetical protein